MTDLKIANMLADYHKECDAVDGLADKGKVQLKHAQLIREEVKNCSIHVVMQRFLERKMKYEKEYEELQQKINDIYKSKKEPYILETYEENLVILHGKIKACKEILENVA